MTSGLTVGSLLAGVFCTLLLGIIIHYAEVILSLAAPAEHALALPVIWIFGLLLLVVGVVKVVGRVTLLNRAERLCVLYAMLIAAPLMTQGFWHRFVAIIASNPRAADWSKMDAFNDKLWPHGPNLVEGMLAKARAQDVTLTGGTWERIEYDAGAFAELPVLTNTGETESSIRIRLDITKPESQSLVIREPHLASVLVRARDLGPSARYYVRLRADGERDFVDVVSGNSPTGITFQHRTGFARIGAYGVVPPSGKQSIEMEIGLIGPGRLEAFDPKLFSVATLESIYKGRSLVMQSEYDKLPMSDRGGLVVRPDNLLSIAGVKFILGGYIPISDWLMPLAVWTSFILLILLGTLALVAIFRRQWLDNERYPLPLTHVTEMLADTSLQVEGRLIWRSRALWVGFVLAILFVLMRATAFYHPGVPDPTIKVTISEFVGTGRWGGMFDGAVLHVHLIFLALCSFMELNILLSLVIGALLFRSQRWAGEVTGWNRTVGFPWPYEQTVSAFVSYALVTLVLARRYIAEVLRHAIRGTRDGQDDEILSYRSAVLLMIGTLVCVALWAKWLNIGIVGMLCFFGFLLMVGFVSAKLRAEAGLPWGYFTPGNAALFMTALGGIPMFGPEAMLFCYVASFFLAPTVFFFIPGAQLEVIELGRRWQVRRSHLIMTIILGVMGGMILGGWTFLSNAYALGGDTMPYSWAFDSKAWYFFSYNDQLGAATNQYLDASQGQEAAGGTNPMWYAMGLSAGVTIVISVLRQLFAGFWFHPIGWILGTGAGSGMFIDLIWGSALAAWIVRGVTLWLGGAQAVRNKLRPFMIGVFLGAVFAELLLGVHTAFLRGSGVQRIFNILG